MKEVLEKFLTISDQDWSYFASILTPMDLPKKDFLLRAGQKCPGVYFLEMGTLRTYYLSEGKEVNIAFNFELEFLREIESLSTDQPSKYYIQAIEDCRLYLIPKEKLTELYQSSPLFLELGRKILEQIAVTEQRYAALLAGHSPMDRYKHILEVNPALIQRIPLQNLASYLGISRESLSRIRKRLS